MDKIIKESKYLDNGYLGELDGNSLENLIKFFQTKLDTFKESHPDYEICFEYDYDNDYHIVGQKYFESQEEYEKDREIKKLEQIERSRQLELQQLAMLKEKYENL